MNYQKTNDVDLQKLDLILDSGDAVSLLDLFTDIEISQDMFISHSMFCSITIADTLDLYSRLPIKNNEELHIVFKSTDNDLVDKKLKLYSRENVLLGENGRTTYYTLKFVSPETIRNIQVKDSRSYEGRLSDIAGAIWSKHFSDFSPLKSERSSDEDHTIVLPYDNPFSHILTLSKKAKREANTNDCNFMFFEDFYGWNFVSVASLFEQPQRGYFSWEFYGPDESRVGDGLDTKSTRFKIQEMDIIGNENYIDEAVNGLYTGYINQPDILNKTMSNLKFEYKDAVDNITKANPFPLQCDKILENQSIISNYSNRYKTVFDNGVLLNRKSQISSLLNKRIRFKVSGSSSVNAGDKIKVDFVKQTGIDPTGDPLNKYRSGFYIVTSIKHIISKATGYTMNIEACTDSLSAPVPDLSNFETDDYLQS